MYLTSFAAVLLAIAIGQALEETGLTSFADTQSRIINGENAAKGEIPYIVLLSGTSAAGNPTVCGASLIDAKYLLTAAHCICVGKQMTAVLGTIYRWPPITEEGTYQTYNIPPENIIVHENYTTQTIKNDIALVRLPQSCNFTAYIQPVILPCLYTTCSKYEGKEALIAGWGRTSDEKRTASPILQVATLKIMKTQECATIYKRLSYNIAVTQVCTENQGSTTCTGDSGGPLTVMCDDNSYQLMQTGLVSFGTMNCSSGYPTVYTNICSYLIWIYKYVHPKRCC